MVPVKDDPALLTPAPLSYDEMARAYSVARAAGVNTEVACPSCGAMHVKRTYNNVFCAPHADRASCKDVYWNSVRPSERAGRTTDQGHARAAERRALMKVLAVAIQQQLGGRVECGGKALVELGPGTTLELEGVADAVLSWAWTRARLRSLQQS